LLLIPFALKTEYSPLPSLTLGRAVPDILSRVVGAARVPVKKAAVRGTRPRQPAPEEPGRLRMTDNGPVCRSTAPARGACANPGYPYYSLLLIPQSVALNWKPFQVEATRKYVRRRGASSGFLQTNELRPSVLGQSPPP